jgi:hypothetical protein
MEAENLTQNQLSSLRIGAFWPTPAQECLLRAALLRGPAAQAAWEQWSAQVDLDTLDAGSFRLLPLLYVNLEAEGVRHPLMSKLKGIYRYHWTKTRVLFYQAALVLDRLHASGFQTLLLKGAALATLYYPNPGLRPMDDFDVLVPLSQAAAAAAVLAAAGWQPILQRPLHTFTPAYFSVRPGHGFRNAAGQACDLHWHVLFQACQPGADESFWQAAMPLAFQGRATLALSPADQLLHLCAHGTMWNPVSSARWAADALLLLHAAAIDWPRLVAQAQAFALTLPLADTLAYLKGLLNAPVPDTVVEQLKAMPASGLERRAYESWANPPNWRYLLPQLESHYRLYSPMGRGRSPLGQVAGRLRFVQQVWGVDHLWQLPGAAWSKLLEWWHSKRLFLK